MIRVYSSALKYVSISSLARSRSINRALCNTFINEAEIKRFLIMKSTLHMTTNENDIVYHNQVI